MKGKDKQEKEKIYNKLISAIEKGYKIGELTKEQKKQIHGLRKYENVKIYLKEMKEEIKKIFSEHKDNGIERQKIAKQFRCFFKIAIREL